jgi:hypothetical protein
MGFMDHKNSLSKRIMGQNKVDPGTFSMMEPGWWALHAVAIAGVYLLGRSMQRQ